MYLHVLARLEALAAHGAGVRQVARRVHVQDVLFEVAVVAVQLAALGAGGLARLTVCERAGGRVSVPLLARLVARAAGRARARACARARARTRPGRSWGRRRSRSVRATPTTHRLSLPVSI